MLKQDLALNNQQWLMCYKTQPNQTMFAENEKNDSNIPLLPGKEECDKLGLVYLSPLLYIFSSKSNPRSM